MVADTHLDILVHPLVLLSISDYYTRVSIRTQSRAARILGICLGSQAGRQVSLEATFEASLSSNAQNEIDSAFLEARLDQYKQVFPQLEVMGWFTIASQVGEFEHSIQTFLSTRFDSPLLLALDPQRLDSLDHKNATELPLKVYEMQTEVRSSAQDGSVSSQSSFVELGWALETGEAERIAVDHVAKAQVQDPSIDAEDSASAALISHYTAQANAIKMLSARLALLTSYVQDVKDNKVAPDHDVLRKIQALLQRLPVMQSSAFRQESVQERSDVLLTKNISGLMNGTRALSDLIETYAIFKSRNTRGLGAATGWV